MVTKKYDEEDDEIMEEDEFMDDWEDVDLEDLEDMEEEDNSGRRTHTYSREDDGEDNYYDEAYYEN